MAVVLNGQIIELTAADIWAYINDPLRTLTALRQGVSFREIIPPSLAEEFFAERGLQFENAIFAKHEWISADITIEEAIRKKTLV